MSKKSKTIDDETLDLVINSYNDGNSLDKLSKTFKVSRKTLTKLMQSKGVVIRNNHIWIHHVDSVLKVYNLTKSVSCVMKTLNLKRDVVTTVLKKNNISLISMKDKYKGIDPKNHPAYKGAFDSGSRYLEKIRCNAKKRNISVTISIDDMNKIWNNQNGKCALSGLPITYYGDIKNTFEHQTASLDRIDSNQDYSINNVQWVHKHINAMKFNFDLNQFIEICKNITYPIINYNYTHLELKLGDYYYSLKSGAKRRNLNFNIKKEDILELYSKQKYSCKLTGVYIHRNYKTEFKEANNLSVDRIDSSKGYQLDNIQLIDKRVNQMKWDFDQNYFKSLCKEITYYQRSLNNAVI